MQPPDIYIDLHCSLVLAVVLKIQNGFLAYIFFPLLDSSSHSTVQPPLMLHPLKHHCSPSHFILLSWKNSHKEDLFYFQSAKYLLETSVQFSSLFAQKGKERGSELWRFRCSWSIFIGAEQFHLCQLILWCDFNNSESWLIRFQKITEKKWKRKQPTKTHQNIPS